MKIYLIILFIFNPFLSHSFSQNKDTTIYSTDTLDVKSSYFKKAPDANVSYSSVTGSEIWKAPGALEDVIKFFQSRAGVSSGYDLYNDLIVRGGAPSENLTLIDGMEIPNPNHFGIPGTNTGLMSYISPKLVKDVSFYSGGFPAKYGDKLSSVMDIEFKDGSATDHIQELNLSIAGFGGFFEGPLLKNSSYVFSIRRSYLQLLKDQLGDVPIPNFWDANLKLVNNLGRNEKISLIGFYVKDKAFNENIQKEVGNIYAFTALAKYENLFGKNIFNISAGINLNNTSANYDNAQASFPTYNIEMLENNLGLKSEYKYYLSDNNNLEFTAGGTYVFSDADINARSYVTPTSYILPELDESSIIKTYKLSASINSNNYLFNEKIVVNAGGRADYFEYIDQGLTISPRFGISYKIFPNTYLNASAGIFYQAPSQIILAINENNKNLNNIRVNQYIIGVEHFLNSELLFNIEAYVKQYSDYPVSISDPYSVFINYGTLFGTSYLTEAISAGSGVFRGLDISLIKKSGSYGFFGSLAISLSSSDFHTAIPITFPLNFDYGKQMTLVAGYQFYNDWTVGIRLKAAGGKPYTPFNESESKKFGLGLYDMNKFYSERLPSYQNVDLRIDKKIYFNSVTFSAYLEIQNLLNRENVYDYSWSYRLNLQEVNYNWEILPIIGMNVKF